MPAVDQRKADLQQVLVVEDDRMVSEIIVLMLEEHYQTVVVETVDEALQCLAADDDRPRMILLDCLLPGGGLAELLAAADARSIGVVLISGDPNRAARLDFGRRFLPKPFSQAQLLDMLRGCCG